MQIHWEPPADMAFILPTHNFAYISVTKCASTSFRRAFSITKPDTGPDRASLDEARRMDYRFAVIRHPVPRLMSAYSYGWDNMSFAEFWEHFRDHPHDDMHTMPYVDIIQDVPTNIFRLEELDQWWPRMRMDRPQLFTELPVLNARNKGSTIPQLTLEQLTDIERVYANDFKLWRSL